MLVTGSRVEVSRAVERDALLVERHAEHLQGEPGAQRPGRVVLVADDEQHGAQDKLNRWLR